ncbi:TPA: hypothetical protein ACN326_004728 [Vibrio parahaemolyticus]
MTETQLDRFMASASFFIAMIINGMMLAPYGNESSSIHIAVTLTTGFLALVYLYLALKSFVKKGNEHKTNGEG